MEGAKAGDYIPLFFRQTLIAWLKVITAMRSWGLKNRIEVQLKHTIKKALPHLKWNHTSAGD